MSEDVYAAAREETRLERIRLEREVLRQWIMESSAEVAAGRIQDYYREQMEVFQKMVKMSYKYSPDQKEKP